MSQLIIPCPCGKRLPRGSNGLRRYCNDCKNDRQRDNQNRKNRSRAGLREYDKLQINLVKNWIYWGLKK